MTKRADIAARLLAWHLGGAVTIHETSSLAPDPEFAFGIAPIRIVSEQQLQSVAFGLLGSEPLILTRWNPMSRESGDLEPFAAALDAYLSAALDHEIGANP